MKPRIRYPSKDYDWWMFWIGSRWNEGLIDNSNRPRYEFNKIEVV